MSEPTTHDKHMAMPKILEAARTMWIWGLSTERPDEALHRFVQTNPDLRAYVDAATKEA
jgi:hypothetical protein